MNLNNQAIANSCGIGRTTVREYVFRAALIERRKPIMLSHPTLEKLQSLKLAGMLKAYTEQMEMPATSNC
jgi:hypothetical protein